MSLASRLIKKINESNSDNQSELLASMKPILMRAQSLLKDLKSKKISLEDASDVFVEISRDISKLEEIDTFSLNKKDLDMFNSYERKLSDVMADLDEYELYLYQ